MALMITTTLIDSFLSVCLKTMSLTYSTSEFLICGTHTHIKNRIEKLDIVNKIEIISEFIKENQFNINKHKSLTLAVSKIMDVIKQINCELENIQNECKSFEQRYFTYWRTPDCENYIKTLENLCIIFKDRYTILFQCMNTTQH